MEPAQTFRIFVSSPGDAQFERQRVDRVVARLNGELSGSAQFTTVRWETEFYKADSTFQAQIPHSVDCSVVVAIFRARLGTELPPEFERMEDGEPYPSGTAYEVLTAISHRQSGAELPDVFVFRCSEPPRVSLDDDRVEADARTQWSRLKGFFARWFLTEEGHFRAAFQTFASTDDFEEKLERLLRGWLRQRLAREGITTWPIATLGSPYPGLLSFGPRHAPVFFGRARDIAVGVEAWSESGQGGTPFLLVVGASGAGKSSLARAGLVPRLTTPGVVPAVDAWRVAAMRPGQSPDGPVAALAHALLQGATDLPGSEEGRQPAVPEIAAGDYRTAEDLAALLGHADPASIRPVLAALDKVGEGERLSHGYDRPVRCDLVLLVDQLDELFATAVAAEERTRFATLLRLLVGSGRVWVVATLRADLYELFLRDETLFGLKGAGATLDLTPPVLSDMAEAVRGPARAAGLAWEVHPATREPLDDRLIRDIDRPDLLPIVQFTLDRLFQQREVRDGRAVLTHAAYEALGTLDGAIERAAEDAIAPLGPTSAEALPRLLRALVASTGSGGGTPALRQAPREAASHDPASESLVGALTDARILISGRDPDGTPVVALAHQRVIEAWPRARDAIARSADVLRVRDDMEAAERRWEGQGRRNDLLIAPGLALSEAENALAALRGELAPGLTGFVERSGRAARLRHRIVQAAAIVFLILAIGAGGLGYLAREQQQRAEVASEDAQEQTRQAEAARGGAERQRQAAETARAEAVRQQTLAEEAKRESETRLRAAEVRLATADELLADSGQAQQLRQCEASTLRGAAEPPPPASREFFVGRWHVDQVSSSSDIDWRADGVCAIKTLFSYGVQLPVTGQPDECTWSYEPVSTTEFVINVNSKLLGAGGSTRMQFRILSPVRLHTTDFNHDAFRIYCPAGEVARLRAKVAAREAAAKAEPDDLDRQGEFAAAIEQLSDVLNSQGDLEAALAELDRSQQIRQRLALADGTGTTARAMLARGYTRLGFLHGRLLRLEPALQDFEAAVAILLKLVQQSNNTDVALQHDLALAAEQTAIMLNALGRDKPRVVTILELCVGLRRTLAENAPKNAWYRVQLVITLVNLSKAAPPDKARAALEEALTVLTQLETAKELPPGYASWPGMVRAMMAQRS